MSGVIRAQTTVVHLTDDELSLLDGRCSENVQEKVAEALRRIDARGTVAGLSDAASGFISDVLAEAREQGRILFQSKRLSWCRLCGRHGGYAKYKSGPNRGLDNHKKPLRFNGYEFTYRFVTMDGSANLGGCVECIEPLLPHLIEAFRGVNVEVPERLRAEGEPVRVRWYLVDCRACGWHGHEGQMRFGVTPGFAGRPRPYRCPTEGCRGELHGFGTNKVERRDEWVVVEQPTVPQVRS